MSPIASPAPLHGPRPHGFSAARWVWPLLAIAAAAAAGRLLGLGDLIVWHDEVFSLIRIFGYSQSEAYQTVFNGQLLAPADLLRLQTADPNHTWGDTWRALTSHPEHAPLFYLLARLATGLGSEPLGAVRGLSALFGILLIPAVYWLARELFGRGLAPLLAATLVAVSPLQLLYAQEARQYALWLLLLSLASAALIRALREDRGRDWALYGLLVALGLYSHLLFLVLLPVHAAYALLARCAWQWPTKAHAGHRWPLRCAWRPGRRTWRWLIGVGVALLVFAPWLWVVVTQSDRLVHYTQWMTRPIGLNETFGCWATHFVRAFVDLGREPPRAWWWLALLPLAYALPRFARAAPRPAVWLPLLILAAGVATVLGPDLLQGGSRSQHVRYALPALLALQIMVAWVIADALASTHARSRRVAGLTLTIVLAAGLGSHWTIHRAETWSTKKFSADNGAIAAWIGAGERPLVLASDSGVALGELISLASRLPPKVRILAVPGGESPRIPPGFDRWLVLTPNASLREAIGQERRLRPFPGSWQWFQAEPAEERRSQMTAAATTEAPEPPP